jgi:hypothetical protein
MDGRKHVSRENVDVINVSDGTRILRYIRLPQFIEMLMTRSLFQISVEKFDDPAEGSYGWKSVEFAPAIVSQYTPTAGTRHYTIFQRDADPNAPVVEQLTATTPQIISAARQRAAVTCWYEFDGRESYGMWKNYGGEFAVAIESTVGDLRRVFAGMANVTVAGVSYCRLLEKISSVDTLFFHKREEFKDEYEIRSVQLFNEPFGGVVAQSLDLSQLNSLMRTITLSPAMRSTMEQSLASLIYGIFNAESRTYSGVINRSRMNYEPLPV